MKAFVSELPWRGLALVAGMLLFGAGCTDEQTTPWTGAPPPALEALLTCFVDLSAESMACGPAEPGAFAAAGGSRANLIVGSQDQFVRLTGAEVTIVDGIFNANVTVQNLTLQPFGTVVGNTPEGTGVQVFFVDEPSNDVVVSNSDGTAAFLGSDPATYYQYSGGLLGGDGILSPGEVSSTKSWQFTLNGATEFVFSVLVSTTVPDPAAYGVHLTRVVAGAEHTCGEGSNGRTYCWGYNGDGQLGNRTSRITRTTPTAVYTTAGLTLSNLALGQSHSCAEGSNGTAYCWGSNHYGEAGVGIGTLDSYFEPIAVAAPPGVTLTGLVASLWRTCAEGSDNKIYCWGSNWAGQIGDGTDIDRWAPVAVDAPAGVTLSGLAMGELHTCAEGSDGKTYCWGSNWTGQLGDGTEADRATPDTVATPPGLTLSRLSAGQHHTCAEGSDNRIYCWGRGNVGQLGNGTDSLHSKPVAVDAPAGVTLSRPAAGEIHTCGQGSDGKVYCWGYNRYGELGDSTTAKRLSPVAVHAPAGVTLSGLAASRDRTCAKGSDGRAYCWGRNHFSQLGDGTNTQRLTPVVVAGTQRP